MVANDEIKFEAVKLIISINDYKELLYEIEQNIPMKKSSSYWKILTILDKNKEILNINENRLYF